MTRVACVLFLPAGAAVEGNAFYRGSFMAQKRSLTGVPPRAWLSGGVPWLGSRNQDISNANG